MKIDDNEAYNNIRKKIIETKWEKEVSYLETSYLYDTLGFPFEVTLEFCETHNLIADKEKFNLKMNMFQELSKSSSDFVTGFLDDQKVLGRPAAPLMLSDGSLLISDDHANAIYRISPSL